MYSMRSLREYVARCLNICEDFVERRVPSLVINCIVTCEGSSTISHEWTAINTILYDAGDIYTFAFAHHRHPTMFYHKYHALMKHTYITENMNYELHHFVYPKYTFTATSRDMT